MRWDLPRLTTEATCAGISPVSRRRPRALGSLDRKIGERLPHLHRQGLADLKHAGDDADRDQRDHQKRTDQRAGRHQVGQ